MMKLLLYQYFVLTSGCCVYLANGVHYKNIAVTSRLRRSIFALGKQAAERILKDAIPIKRLSTEDKTFFAKYGGYNRAVDDFYSVKPIAVGNIRNKEMPGGVVKGGKIGDRLLTLVKGSANVPASLSITKTVDIPSDPNARIPTKLTIAEGSAGAYRIGSCRSMSSSSTSSEVNKFKRHLLYSHWSDWS